MTYPVATCYCCRCVCFSTYCSGFVSYRIISYEYVFISYHSCLTRTRTQMPDIFLLYVGRVSYIPGEIHIIGSVTSLSPGLWVLTYFVRCQKWSTVAVVDRTIVWQFDVSGIRVCIPGTRHFDTSSYIPGTYLVPGLYIPGTYLVPGIIS